MSQTARNNSHASSACVSCRKKKRKCSGTGPTCVSCAEKNIQCEWTTETDGRRIAHNLQLENASLRAEVAELRALVEALRADALEELSYYATQHLPPYLDGGLAALEVQTNGLPAHGPHVALADRPLYGSNADNGSSCPTLRGPIGAAAPAEAAIGPSAQARGVQVNVFGTGVAPLFTGDAIVEDG